ncbi:MAG: hypothetical protein KGO47_06190 [Cyanobacteria bacterium REEB417]|nr:hypothetical protein [Cyanobacteria bacterium REEB417]
MDSPNHFDLEDPISLAHFEAPLTASTGQALNDLELDRLLVITPGQHSYRRNARTEVTPLAEALRVTP